MSTAIRKEYAAQLIGQKFNKLLVVRKVCSSNWECVCECGNKIVTTTYQLRSEKTKSCGCYSRDRTTKHGMEGSRIYNTWAQMVGRCHNPNATSYKYYGAKGIKVCDEWRDFRAFYADMGDKQEGKTLDRIDPTKDYCKENCRWSDSKTQGRNKANTKMLEFRGETKPMSEWAELMGLGRKVVETRIRNGWDVEKALTKPAKRTK